MRIAAFPPAEVNPAAAEGSVLVPVHAAAAPDHYLPPVVQDTAAVVAPVAAPPSVQLRTTADAPNATDYNAPDAAPPLDPAEPPTKADPYALWVATFTTLHFHDKGSIPIAASVLCSSGVAPGAPNLLTLGASGLSDTFFDLLRGKYPIWGDMCLADALLVQSVVRKMMCPPAPCPPPLPIQLVSSSVVVSCRLPAHPLTHSLTRFPLCRAQVPLVAQQTPAGATLPGTLPSPETSDPISYASEVKIIVKRMIQQLDKLFPNLSMQWNDIKTSPKNVGVPYSHCSVHENAMLPSFMFVSLRSVPVLH